MEQIIIEESSLMVMKTSSSVPDLSHLQPGEHPGWGVGEHTDYGLITILA